MEKGIESVGELTAKEQEEHRFLKLSFSDTEVERVVKRMLNWYWGYDKAEGSQEITNALYKFGLHVIPEAEDAKRAQEHFQLLKEKGDIAEFYKDKAMKYLEQIEGLELEIYKIDPNNKLRDMSSIVNKFPYADAELKEEVKRANARESSVIDALSTLQGCYNRLLTQYWNLKRKYEPSEPSSNAVCEGRASK